MVYLGKDRKFAIPFGPFLAAGALLSLFLGDALIRWYLGTMMGDLPA
jgi:leader peptidase (prepilin peptidase)/N-methyltransferase